MVLLASSSGAFVFFFLFFCFLFVLSYLAEGVFRLLVLWVLAAHGVSLAGEAFLAVL